MALQNPAEVSNTIQWVNLVWGAVLGAVIGFLGARATAWRDRRIQLQKIARSLMQETHRIRDELGKRPDTIVFLGGEDLFAIRSIHPWMQALVPEASLIHADVVGDFLRLDCDLHNLAVVRGWYVEFVKVLGAMPATYGVESKKHRDAKAVAAEKRVEFAEANANVVALLGRIDKQLTRHV